MRLLLVEDDRDLAHGVASALIQSGYAVDSVANAVDAFVACTTTQYQLIVLDLGLPDWDGIDLLRRLRGQGVATPVLILTARDELTERVRGLDAGGDDYLSKPFAIAELEARIRALLRRGEPTNASMTIGRLTFEPTVRRFLVDGRELELTARELAVLELLLRRSGRIVSKAHLFDSLYSWDHEANLTMIEVFVSRLRRKLETAHAGVEIRVFRGLGYRLEEESSIRENA